MDRSGGLSMGKLIAVCFAAMAAIPLLMGALIFAPVILVLALLCVWAERRD
jgi:hypothetical protein